MVLQGRHIRVSSSPDKANTGLRMDIQGLRTLAVGLVIFYHIWPELLPGGFVGVDVFFVISGFLIVGSLVRELSDTGRIRLSVFYAKRIRRLLPAASVVLIATTIATVIFLPQNRWQSISLDVIMSGLQVQNWNQAFSENSYAGATAAVSPVQHYWSLAVEEQFYLVTPLILLAGVAVAAKLRLRIETICLAVLATVSLASFVHSIMFSSTEHGIAYFATSTRMWELGMGGIAAVLLPKMHPRAVFLRAAGWIGLCAILYSALTFSTAMDFPGSVALLPVLATVLVVASGASHLQPSVDRGYSVTRLLSLRPVTYVGDLSYSLYLWHWPVVVFYVFLLGRTPGYLHGAAIVGISFGLAVTSYYFVEQRFRHAVSPFPGLPLKARRWRPLAGNALVVAAGLIAATTIPALAPWVVVEVKSQQLSGALNLREYPGATAFDPSRPASVPDALPVQPDPAVALKDVPLTGKDECGTFDPANIRIEQCLYGPVDASKTMVVVGDSHAAQYVDALLIAGTPSGWNVRAMVRNGCPFSTSPPADGTTVYHNCSEQNKVTLERILLLRPQLVVVSGMTPAGYQRALKWGWDNPQALVDGYVEVLKPLRAAGIRVAVVGDNPYPDVSTPECVSLNGTDSPMCQTRMREVDARTDPLQLAGAQVPGVELLDMSAYFCRQGVCPAVIGNVMVYRDNHMTNTFAKTLAPALAQRLNF